MTWAKIDDRLHSHPKIDALLEADELRGAAALGLWVAGLSHVAGQLTDGRITRRAVQRLLPEHGQELAALLVEYGLWDALDDGGWEIRGYLDCNPSRADVEARREADRQRQAKSRSHRKSHRDTQRDDTRESQRPVPVPSRPVPTREESEEESSSPTSPAVAHAREAAPGNGTPPLDDAGLDRATAALNAAWLSCGRIGAQPKHRGIAAASSGLAPAVAAAIAENLAQEIEAGTTAVQKSVLALYAYRVGERKAAA